MWDSYGLHAIFFEARFSFVYKIVMKRADRTHPLMSLPYIFQITFTISEFCLWLLRIVVTINNSRKRVIIDFPSSDRIQCLFNFLNMTSTTKFLYQLQKLKKLWTTGYFLRNFQLINENFKYTIMILIWWDFKMIFFEN